MWMRMFTNFEQLLQQPFEQLVVFFQRVDTLYFRWTLEITNNNKFYWEEIDSIVSYINVP